MADEEPLEALAARLIEAERVRRPLASQGTAHDLDDQEAYRVQEIRSKLHGRRELGYKLGFTSQAMREQMSVPSPNYGRLDTEMELVEPVLDLDELIHPRLEPEVALYVERTLAGSDITRADVAHAIQWGSSAIEVVDSRYRGYEFTPNENTADNSSAARFILGERKRIDSFDGRLIGVLLSRNGSSSVTGIGANALGDPLLAVRWLCRELAKVGRGLEAGSVVLTGGLTMALAAGKNDSFVAEFAHLGTLTLRCIGTPAEEV